MKHLKFALAFGLCLLFSAAEAFSAGNSPMAPDAPDFALNAAKYVQLDILASTNAMETPKGLALMREYSTDLGPWYKEVLFERYKKDAVGAALLNSVTGGIGSWAMGDKFAGATLTIGALALTTATVALLSNVDFGIPKSDALSILTTSGIAITASGIVLPFISAVIKNGRLKRALSY